MKRNLTLSTSLLMASALTLTFTTACGGNGESPEDTTDGQGGDSSTPTDDPSGSGGSSTDDVDRGDADGALVGAACSNDSECTGPGTPDCLTSGIYPLSDLASSSNETAVALSEIGVPLPGGYCSTVAPCATDADCGIGGSCFFPLKDVDPATYSELVGALALPADDAAVLNDFTSYGQCLSACETNDDCSRDDYVCATPIADFLSLVPDADLSTFCIGDASGSTVDHCDPDPCENGTCENESDTYSCSCDAGWMGADCDTEVSGCADAPCVNGSCADTGPGLYECSCDDGYDGANCDNDIDECTATSNPCSGHGACTDAVNGYSCSCDAGYDGDTCENNIDECAANPCQNGTCTDAVADYVCACDAGYDGKDCDNDIDECAATANPCSGHGTCNDDINSYSCTCDDGYDSSDCSNDIDECAAGPCQNGGICSDLVNDYSCTCEDGYDGKDCDNNIDECAATSNPCSGNGECTDEVATYSCECDAGWTGASCQTEVFGCDEAPCQNGGSCDDTGGGTYSCTCLDGFGGTNCDVDYCASNPCTNGTCSGTPGGRSCTCDPGYSGTDCDVNIDECAAATNPCNGNGSCNDGVNTFTCTCYDGYDGDNCETDIDECAAATSPCNGNGTCHDAVNGFSCTCADGYGGATCNVDYCNPDPCDNGSCSGVSDGYSCSCNTGYDGTNCDNDINECAADPCVNGSCNDLIGSYSCTCATGYEGANCDQLIPTTHCTLTYTLEEGDGGNGDLTSGSNMRIRETAGTLGDGTRGVGPGTLILRVVSDGGQGIADGEAEILYYELPQVFSFTTFGLTVATNVTASCSALDGNGDYTPRATGALATGETPAITWGDCTYPDGYNDDKNSFTPDVEGTGDGCLAPYRSVGNVNCTGENILARCSAGNLQSGDNDQNETWEQKLETFTFNTDMTTFSMPFMQVPNRSPSTTFTNLEGTRTSIVCE